MPAVEPAVLTTLAGACRDHHLLRFDYRDHGGATSRRSGALPPGGLGRRLSLVAWDTARRDWRTFRVDRIEPRPPTGPRFAPATCRKGTSRPTSRRLVRRVALPGAGDRPRPGGADRARINPAVGVLEPVDATTCVLDTGAATVEIPPSTCLLGADFEVDGPSCWPT